MDLATRTLHEAFLRLMKGMLAAYEVWLRSRTKGAGPGTDQAG